MGWVWRYDEEDEIDSSAGGVSSGKRCSTRKVVKSQCRTEEVERGKFIRKCEKTEQVLRECVGKYVTSFIYLLLVWLPRNCFKLQKGLDILCFVQIFDFLGLDRVYLLFFYLFMICLFNFSYNFGRLLNGRWILKERNGLFFFGRHEIQMDQEQGKSQELGFCVGANKKGTFERLARSPEAQQQRC